jgi:uncharacterized protein
MRDIIVVTNYVKEKMSGESTGHDWFHVERVFKTATKIAKKEKNVDLFIVQAAALLHDLGDWKVNYSEKTEEEIVAEACQRLSFSDEDTEKIQEIILNMSYSKNIGSKKKLCVEGRIVQDADRLEALGAIGIARAFAYGGKKNRPLYDPDSKPDSFTSTEAYRTAQGHTINHFYEKLFKLIKLLNTQAAKDIAIKREIFMKSFLKEFYAEWNGRA